MIYSITEIQARYQETDQMGVIYHGNYPTWFEVARTDYINKLGFSYKDMEDNGVISPVTELDIKYIKSVTYPEKLKLKRGSKDILDSSLFIAMKYIIKLES